MFEHTMAPTGNVNVNWLSSFGTPIFLAALPVSSRGVLNLENHWAFVAIERASEATKSKRKEPLGVAEKAKKTPEQKAQPRQQTTEEDCVFVAAPQEPDLNEPTGYG